MGSTESFEVVVLGGGSGLTVADLAARAGKLVCVIEHGPMGGTCLNRGCIPTKGLIQSAEVLKTIREAGGFGVHVDPSAVKVDFPAIMEKIRARRKRMAEASAHWARSAFPVYNEWADFAGNKRLMVGNDEIVAERVFLAMGTSPVAPPIDGLEKGRFLTNESVLELKERPESLIILGGGYVGAELAYFFHQVGTKVTVVDSSKRLLREDADVRELFTKEFAKYVELYNGWRGTRVVHEDGSVKVTIAQQEDAQEKTLTAEALLVAVGRRPNTNGIGLDKTGVELDARGFVKVDEYLRTTNKDIWAIGDVNGQEMFKHTAAYEAQLAWRNSEGAGEPVDYHANPHAVFSDPQIGSVGLTEGEVKAAGLKYRVAKVPYHGVMKGKVVGRPPGFAKAIVEEGTMKILGFHMVGPRAADLVHEVVVAMAAGDGTADNVIRAIHTHPTMPELVKEAFVQATSTD